MIAASFIRAVELLLGERVNLAASIADEIRAGLTTRDAATTEREDAIHADGYVKGLREALRLLRGEEKGGPG